MTVVTLDTRWRSISRNGGSGGYNRNTVAFEDGELWLIQGGLGQVVESFDGVDCKGCGETTVPDADPRGTILVHPTGLPTAVFLLEREKGAEIHLVPDSDGRASKDAHGEGERITLGAYPLLDALTEDRAKGKISVSAFDLLQETGHEEQEAFRSGVVAGAIGIPPVDEDFPDPSKRAREFFTAAVCVEEGQDVHADDWVKTQSPVIKVCLAKRVE